MNTFFITGVQRSGTTLLSFMLSNHPDILIDDYSIAFRLIHCLKTNFQRVQPNYQELSAEEILQRLIKNDYKGRLAELLDYENLDRYDGIQHLIDASIQRKLNDNGKTHWGDKSPGLQHYLPDLLLLTPHAKIIHIVRDGRATASSLQQRAHKDIRLAAQSWVDGNLLALHHQLIIGKERFLIIRYEDLLEKTEETMRSICVFLGLEFHSSILDPSQHELTGNDNSYVKKKLNSDAINRYQQQLSSKQIGAIERIQGPLLQKFGYSLLQKSPVNGFQSLSVGRRLWLNQLTNFKALFRPYQVRMEGWELQKTKVPLRKRLGFFLRMLSYDLLAYPIFEQLFERKNKRLPDDE